MRKHCSRVIIENFFEPCVLFLLLKGPAYGYDLKKKLGQDCQCEVNIGNLYRGLSRLSDLGYITKQRILGTKGPDRVEYGITEEGKTYLSEWISELECQNETLTRFITNYKKQL
jgi:PadR family transcriptional regulator PadR